MAAEQFADAPSVGDVASAAWAAIVARNGVIVDIGFVTLTPTVLNTAVSTTATFTKEYPSAPRVFTDVATSGPHLYAHGATAANTTQATIWLTQTSGSLAAKNVLWIAVLTP